MSSNNGGNGANYSSWGSAGGAGTQGSSTDQEALAQFLSTQAGSQFAGTNTNGIIQQTGTNQAVPQWLNGSGQDISAMMSAFAAWQADQSNENQTWQNYADLVAKQAGSGQNTILGSALTPYQSLLSAQQNAGVVGNPASAMSIGTIQKKVGAP